MKTLLAILATTAFSLVALPTKAEARSCNTGHSYTYAIGKTSCGCTIYQRRVIVGYDCHRRPIYRYYSVPVTHRCRSHYRSPYYRSYNRNCGSRNYYYNNNYRSYYGNRSISYHTRYGSVRICR